MRDVTDNVTGELDVVVKLGRGRPRKEGALTNAQRQAAFRARRKGDSVTVTNMPARVVHQVDMYDECRIEVEYLCEALAMAKDERNEAFSDWRDLHAVVDEFRAENERLRAELADLKATKTVTGGGNGNPISFDLMIDMMTRVRRARGVAGQALILSKGPIVNVRMSDEQNSRLWDAICPSTKTVTRKAVTKKGV